MQDKLQDIRAVGWCEIRAVKCHSFATPELSGVRHSPDRAGMGHLVLFLGMLYARWYRVVAGESSTVQFAVMNITVKRPGGDELRS